MGICNTGDCHVERVTSICFGKYPVLVYSGMLSFWFCLHGIFCGCQTASRDDDILLHAHLPTSSSTIQYISNCNIDIIYVEVGFFKKQ